ncbi:MAG: right-handed parallel beta-helix repeat-containing protein, partial [Phycisphaerae bacterium]|nr:right-handed parallel beta-helix repeat-containing protein [Phycisphaerae bacterium]
MHHKQWPSPALTILFLAASLCTADTLRLDPPVHLSNGSEFTTWQDTTAFTQTFHVDASHPAASDDNPGTEDKPFKTINRAAQVLQPAQRVLVKSGTYREFIRPRNGGTGPDRMISYEAAPGATVIIKGSRLVTTGWQPSAHDSAPARPGIWMLRLDPEWFPGNENPFLIENASKEDIDVMPWAVEWTGKLPYTLVRGLVFQNEQRLTQVPAYKDLESPGTYWVDRPAAVLHVHTLAAMRPDAARIEITTQQHLLMPEKTDLGYIRIKGFTFEHAGNGLPRTGVGAVYTNGGHHWIIEDNVVRQAHSVGIEIGARTDETRAGRRADTERAEANPGRMIVRNNEIRDCGTGGIQGLRIKHALVERNHIHHCGWMDVQRYWETGAIKLLLNDDTLVRANHIHDITAAPAIWMDYNNRNTRVSGNLIYNVSSINGAIFMEASQVPNLVDNNIVINTTGSAIYQHDCDELTIAHNLIIDCTKHAVEMRICQGRMVNGRLSTCKRNTVVNNLFIRAARGTWFLDDDNSADRNIFAECGPEFDFAAWKAKGFAANSRTAKIAAAFDPATQTLTWSTPDTLPNVPAAPACTHDY